MENNSDETPEEIHYTDWEIFNHIWTSPRSVFTFINNKHYDKYVVILLVLSGISRALDRAVAKDMGDKLSLGVILAICIIAGGLFGWVSSYFYAALISGTGKWLKGEGNTQSILNVLSYAMIPSILAMLLIIPQLTIYGVEIFKSEGDITSAGGLSNVIFYLSALFEVILGIWTLALCVIGISEVQKLSIGYSILNLLLPVFVIIIPLVILVFIFKGIS